MAKTVTKYQCKAEGCGKILSSWRGTCPACGSFNTIEQVTVSPDSKTASKAGTRAGDKVTPVTRARTLSQIASAPIVRHSTHIGELDRVLGGGFVDSEVVLFAAAPGSGKSTLSLRIAEKFALQGKKILYSSGEESEQQIGLRAKRMAIDHENIRIINETNLETLLGHIDQERPDFLIVDSLQTIASSEISGTSGSVQQSKEAAHNLTRLAKREGIMMLLISQVVKSGDIAGSEEIQHIVDATMVLENDESTPLKFLRTIKNRFGDTAEVGIFQHTETGLEEVSDPSGVSLEKDEGDCIGAACSFISEGVRQIPVEVQALAVQSNMPQARRQFNGVDYNRAQIITAILDKFCETALYSYDLFLSTVSGIKVKDTQADLAIAAAILSSVSNKMIPDTMTFIGELSLTGRVRGTFMVENKIKEAIRLGFTDIIIPKTVFSHKKPFADGVNIRMIESIRELKDLL